MPITPEYADFFRAAPDFYERGEKGYDVVKPGTRYYYCFDNNWNNVHGDIYGEWTVSKETMKNEILRIEDLFNNYSYNKHTERVYELKKGDWNCIVKNDPTLSSDDNTAFEISESGYYRYYIFAYNEKNLKVRYISAYGEEYRGEMPYYMTLEW